MKDYNSLLSLTKKLNLNNIICNDIQAWKKYTNYHHIYNKLWVTESQNIDCGPMGILPENYPVIFKPIINLYGMSRGFEIVNNEEEYYDKLEDGLFWSPYFTGDHYTIDFIIINGVIKHSASLKCYADIKGSFKYHESIPDMNIPENVIKWISIHLKDYIGCANIEIINNNIIEVHLRLNGDYYLYDNNYTLELNKLFNENKWDLDYKINKKYLIPIFIKESDTLLSINIDILKKLLDNYNCDKLLIDNIDSLFQQDDIYRLIMFECDDLEKGLNAKEDILDIIVI